MATVTSAAVVIPSFAGLLKSRPAAAATSSFRASAAPQAPGPRARRCVAVKASALIKDLGVAAVAAAASAALASNAMAMEVLLGGDDGSLAFLPNTFSVASGEKIVFRNNAGFPHNIVFDEDEIPAGVDVSKISMSEEDLLNAPGETFSVTLTEKGTYTFYCSPHQGAGMVGKVTVT